MNFDDFCKTNRARYLYGGSRKAAVVCNGNTE